MKERDSDLIAIVAISYMIEVRGKLRTWMIFRALRWNCEAMWIAPTILRPEREANGTSDEFL